MPAKTDDRPSLRAEARRNTRARFEQWAKNPLCEANTISAVHNVRMDVVAKHLGLDPTFGQSPFALARGNDFERGLFWSDAQRLRSALVEKGWTWAGARDFLDLRLGMNGGPIPTLERAIDLTHELLVEAAAAVTPTEIAAVPSVVASATVRIPKGVMLPEANLMLDVLLLRPREQGGIELVVGEVKTYPDRGGYTDPQQLALARAQAGLYVHALDLTVGALGISDELHVARQGALVLTRPGSNWPSVRVDEDLRYQAERAKRGFELLERAAQALPAIDGDPPTEDDVVAAIVSAPTHYGEACLSFCDRAAGCHAAAQGAGDPIVLGEDVRRFLGTTTLDRTVALLDGAEPADDIERDLLRRIRESDATAVVP